MRLTCPHCGQRDLREFLYKGDAIALSRPDDADFSPDWDEYLHKRDNPAGLTRELWQHSPCSTWIVVERDTTNHEIRSARAVKSP